MDHYSKITHPGKLLITQKENTIEDKCNKKVKSNISRILFSCVTTTNNLFKKIERTKLIMFWNEWIWMGSFCIYAWVNFCLRCMCFWINISNLSQKLYSNSKFLTFILKSWLAVWHIEVNKVERKLSDICWLCKWGMQTLPPTASLWYFWRTGVLNIFIRFLYLY